MRRRLTFDLQRRCVVQPPQHVVQRPPRQRQPQVLRVPVVAQHVAQQLARTHLTQQKAAAAAVEGARVRLG